MRLFPKPNLAPEKQKEKYVAKVEEPIKAETPSLSNKVSKGEKAYEP